jgi:hypothetical protein
MPYRAAATLLAGAAVFLTASPINSVEGATMATNVRALCDLYHATAGRSWNNHNTSCSWTGDWYEGHFTCTNWNSGWATCSQDGTATSDPCEDDVSLLITLFVEYVHMPLFLSRRSRHVTVSPISQFYLSRLMLQLSLRMIRPVLVSGSPTAMGLCALALQEKVSGR